MTPYEELRKKFKLELQTDETFEHFAKRATDKVNKANDDEWRELSEGLQNWVNNTLKAREAKEEVPRRAPKATMLKLTRPATTPPTTATQSKVGNPT
jgi:uncharacterized protein YeaO (DUF488 family)